ncbi:substrate-binding domain-containing protein [Xanthomonas sacchari]|nr:substrate-binding domain-containing protein [Xanthomonas sacchari]
MLRFTLRLLLLGAAALCALPSASAQPAERLRVHGSNSLGARLMPALVEAWLQSMGYRQLQRRRVDATTLEIAAVRDDAPLVVEIAGTGSAAGIADLVHGDAELAMLARQPDAREREAAWQLGDLGSPDQQFVVALDGARVLVAADNPIATLSVAQLRDILSGRTTRWSQLGGAELPIALHRSAIPGGLDDFLRERLGLPAVRMPGNVPACRPGRGGTRRRRPFRRTGDRRVDHTGAGRHTCAGHRRRRYRGAPDDGSSRARRGLSLGPAL